MESCWERQDVSNRINCLAGKKPQGSKSSSQTYRGDLISNRITSYEQAQSRAIQLFGQLNVPRLWIPAKNFRYALEGEETLTFVREDEGFYALAVGPCPVIDPSWNRFSLSRMVDRVLTKDFALRGQWDAYGILSEPFAHENGIEILQGDEEINRFLSEHAPDSSVFAPNPEVKFWGAVRTTEGDLAAIGAMTRWESGEHIISSVATDAQLRGQGYGAALMKGLLGLANRDGIERVGLAVYAKNEAAKRLYEKVGFTCMGRFNYFEPVH